MTGCYDGKANSDNGSGDYSRSRLKKSEISAVDFAGYDEKKYRVVNDVMGKKLRVHIKKQVVADGLITTQNNRLTIHVHQFQIETLDSKHLAR